jgi:hypothetical protein
MPVILLGNSVTLQDLLPDVLQGWSVEKSIPLTAPKDLYSYIDGGAELYISYGFREALSRTYKKENHPEVLAEVFDLIEPRNAFGVFSQTRENENQQFGEGTYTIPGAVFFWKDRFYISLSTWETTSESSDFIQALGSFIDKKINVKGGIPTLMKYLPEEDLVPFGYLYFHHYIWLNSYYFIADDNLLNINDNTDAILAKYAEAEKRQYLLLIQYINKETAAEAFASFGRGFFPEGLAENCIRLEDNTWLAASLTDNIIIAVFNGTTRQSVNHLLINALNKYSALNHK